MRSRAVKSRLKGSRPSDRNHRRGVKKLLGDAGDWASGRLAFMGDWALGDRATLWFQHNFLPPPPNPSGLRGPLHVP